MTNKRSILDEDLNRVVELLGADLSRLKGRNIFLTGGTGFFGRWFVEFFLFCNRCFHTDISITVLSRDPESFIRLSDEYNTESLRFIHGDIKSFDFPEKDYDFILHAAANTNAEDNVKHQLQTIDTIVAGTRRVLEFARLHPPKSLLLVSSGAVYGSAGSGLSCFSETNFIGPDVLSSDAAYGEAKRFSELLAAAYYREHGIKAKIARCFAFVGPFMPLGGRYAVGNFVRDLLAGKEIIVNGDGTPLRSYLYAADLIYWLIRILFDATPAVAYNVGSNESFSIKKIAQTVAANSDREITVSVAKISETGARPQSYLPDISKAERDLGLKVNWSFANAVARTVAWYKADE